MNPSDPCVTSIDNPKKGIFHGWNRAAAQRYYADESGLDFRDVRCLRIYARIFTRQEVWDAEGRQNWADQKNFDAKVGYYFARVVQVPPFWGDDVKPSDIIQTRSLPEGWYSDVDGVTPAKGFTINDAPASPPADWDASAMSYTWQIVDKHHPDAFPAWECSAW